MKNFFFFSVHETGSGKIREKTTKAMTAPSPNMGRGSRTNNMAFGLHHLEPIGSVSQCNAYLVVTYKVAPFGPVRFFDTSGSTLELACKTN